MLISVVIPVYAVEAYLHECVDSVLAQTWDNFEIILVDDGSRDGSGKICDHYAGLDPRVTVIHKKNGGQASARNAGIRCAKGDYLFFIDSDDVIASKNAFSELSAKAETNPDLIVYRYKKWWTDKKTETGYPLSQISTDSKTSTVRDLIAHDSFFCSCWSKMTRASLLKQNDIRFDERSKCEDIDWYFSVIQQASSIELLDSFIIDYRQRPGSVTKTSGDKGFSDNLAFFKKWTATVGDIEDPAWQGLLYAALAKLYCNLLVAFSGRYAVLKPYAKQVYSYKWLLAYDLNPRTKTIRRISRILGVRFTCTLFRIALR